MLIPVSFTISIFYFPSGWDASTGSYSPYLPETSYPQKSKMCYSILVVTLLNAQPHYSQSSHQNATPSSGTSPSAYYKEVPPPPNFFFLKIIDKEHFFRRWCHMTANCQMMSSLLFYHQFFPLLLFHCQECNECNVVSLWRVHPHHRDQ